MKKNPSTPHNYGCSTSREIPNIVRNLDDYDNYKTLQIKMCTQYSPNQYTNKAVCILLGDYDVQKNLPFSIIMTVTKQSNPPITFPSNTHIYIILPSLQRGSSCSGFTKQTLYSLLIYYIHATCHIMYYVNNIW